MCAVTVEWWLGLDRDTIERMRLNTPAGGWFPALQNIRWQVGGHNIPYTDLFLTPSLENIRIVVSCLHKKSEAHTRLQDSVALAMSALPASRLRLLIIAPLNRKVHTSFPWEDFTDSLSSVVLRCGPLLKTFASQIPLSGGAVNHLISLPGLRTLQFCGPPPQPSDLHLPLDFPPLTTCFFAEDSTIGWLSMFQLFEDRARTTQDSSPLARMKESLTQVSIGDDGLYINTGLTSPLLMFQKLTILKMDIYCLEEECLFYLKDDDIKTLAMALPQMKTLTLGHPCRKNTCRTSAFCLLSLSVYCIELEQLEVHLNASGFARWYEETAWEPEAELPRCALKTLVVHEMPLFLDVDAVEEVSDGLANIFPSLGDIQWKAGGGGGGWEEVRKNFVD